LTHIDGEGHASPPVVIENATAANRAVNIPEFVNVGLDQLDRIETPAIDFFKVFDDAQLLADDHRFAEAIPVWKHALEMNSADSKAYNNLGVALAATGQTSEAIEEYKKALALNNESSQTHNNLGSALAEAGRNDEAIVQIRKAIELNPENDSAHVNLGHVLEVMGGHRDEAIAELRKGIELGPKSYEGYNILGVILARMGQLDEAILQLEKSVELAPQSAECRYNLGRALAAAGRFPEALPQFEAAVGISGHREPGSMQMLAAMCFETGDRQRAIATAREALRLATEQNDGQLAEALSRDLARYQAQGGEPR
jgi:tetratricopeptide (TPR) repeat protein